MPIVIFFPYVPPYDLIGSYIVIPAQRIGAALSNGNPFGILKTKSS
jgi:hypothetical protein